MKKTPTYVGLARAHGFVYHQYRYGDIGMADTRARRRGIWQFDRLKGSKDKQVYITCPGCGMVNGIGKHAVDKDGYIYDPKSSYTMGCIICIQCGTHFFVRLKDWKERRTK